jgi:hypothetical protein
MSKGRFLIVLILSFTLSITISHSIFSGQESMEEAVKGTDLTKVYEGPIPIRGAIKGTKFVNHNCMNCHQDIYSTWNKTKHAKAFDSLNPNNTHDKKDHTRNKNCFPCHTTGYNNPDHKRLFIVDELYNNVQCEACHGPGERYWGLMIRRAKERDRMSKKAYDKRKEKWRKKFYAEGGLLFPAKSLCKNCHLSQNTHALVHLIQEKDSPKFNLEAYSYAKGGKNLYPMVVAKLRKSN